MSLRRKNLEAMGFSFKIYSDTETTGDEIYYTITAQKDDLKVGEYVFKRTLPSNEPRHLPEDVLVAVDAETHEDYRRLGLATTAYCLIEEYTNLTLYSSKETDAHTSDGRAFWGQKNRPFGNP